MRKLFLTAVLGLFTCLAFAQTKFYENPRFRELTRNHKIIGIVPFRTTIKLRPKDMKNLSPEQLNHVEIKEGENLQSALYSWFLQREQDGNLLVKVQDISVTNARLEKKGITAENISSKTPKELARILKVDAIVSGDFETTKPMSEAAALAVGIIDGMGIYGSTNKAVINLFIYNGADGETLVNYNKGVSGSLGSSETDLVNTLMRKASRRISYAK